MKKMTSVRDAEKLVLNEKVDFGSEKINIQKSLGRVLSENIFSDRDYPPFNRATMDGVAIKFSSFLKGNREFKIEYTLAAGEKPLEISDPKKCIEIMTGASVPDFLDTVIPIEELEIRDKAATIKTSNIKKGQFIHRKGSDKKKGKIVVRSGSLISPDLIQILASVGILEIAVSKLPRVAIISTGDEFVIKNKMPSKYQIRRSNDMAIWAILQGWHINAHKIQVPDNKRQIHNTLKNCLGKFDVILLTGGISKGKFDYVPHSLEELSVKKIFHGVEQRPGKPFWFGVHKNGVKIFAFPGNPISTFLCMHRYFIPWLELSLKLKKKNDFFARLTDEIMSDKYLTQLIQVKLNSNKNGEVFASRIPHNGSGDFMSLALADAFIEIPKGSKVNKKGSVFRVWPFKRMY